MASRWLCLLFAFGVSSVAAAQAGEDKTPAQASTAGAPAGSLSAVPRVPAERFFRYGGIRDMSVSPSGRWIAATAVNHERRALAVLDATGKQAPQIVASFADGNVVEPRWVTDDWLVFTVVDLDNLSADERHVGSVLKAVKRDGHDLTALTGDVLAVAAGARPVVLLGRSHWNAHGDLDVVIADALDLDSGDVRSLARGRPDHVNQWLFNPAGEPRLTVADDDGRETVYWRGPGEAQWRPIASFSALTPAFTPVYIDDADRLYVRAPQGDAGFSVLKRFDFRTGRPEEDAVVSTPGFDFDGELIVDPATRKTVGVSVTTDAVTTVWFEPRMKAIQAQVDAHLPGHVNRVLCSHCDNPEAVVVESWSDREPTTDWIYRPAHDEWVEIGEEVHGITPAAMGRLDFYRVKARDGEDLPLWLTTPPGPARARPAVVYVHGGPWSRDPSWGWHPAEQFLASRGYVVLQPEFRGSVGYGRKHLQAGSKHWGDTMQDDVADAVHWAADKGFVDPKRICIIGSSYGGYAALMGPIRAPGLYRCAVAWAAVTDPALLYTPDWTSDISEEGRRYVLPSLLGDRATDRALLARASPVDRAAEVRIPVLLAYGLLDRRVPVKHGQWMRDALTEAGNPPQWVLYADEGHGWFNSDDRIDFWQRVERFLAANLR